MCDTYTCDAHTIAHNFLPKHSRVNRICLNNADEPIAKNNLPVNFSIEKSVRAMEIICYIILLSL